MGRHQGRKLSVSGSLGLGSGLTGEQAGVLARGVIAALARAGLVAWVSLVMAAWRPLGIWVRL